MWFKERDFHALKFLWSACHISLHYIAFAIALKIFFKIALCMFIHKQLQDALVSHTVGSYQSHWRLSHHGLYFGHRVWCHIMVDEREVLDHPDQETSSLLQVQAENSPLKQHEYEEVKGSEVRIQSA